MAFDMARSQDANSGGPMGQGGRRRVVPAIPLPHTRRQALRTPSDTKSSPSYFASKASYTAASDSQPTFSEEKIVSPGYEATGVGDVGTEPMYKEPTSSLEAVEINGNGSAAVTANDKSTSSTPNIRDSASVAYQNTETSTTASLADHESTDSLRAQFTTVEQATPPSDTSMPGLNNYYEMSSGQQVRQPIRGAVPPVEHNDSLDRSLHTLSLTQFEAPYNHSQVSDSSGQHQKFQVSPGSTPATRIADIGQAGLPHKTGRDPSLGSTHDDQPSFSYTSTSRRGQDSGHVRYESTIPSHHDDAPSSTQFLDHQYTANGAEPHVEPSQSHGRQSHAATVYPQVNGGSRIPPGLVPPIEASGNLLQYLQSHFASLELSDCTLELHFTDVPDASLRLPGHGLIFSRSPTLSSLLRAGTGTEGIRERGASIIALHTDSQWVRTDSFYLAIQNLYGFPRLRLPDFPSQPTTPEFAGSIRERFAFALSYVAAGDLLQWEPVAFRGCEVVSQLLSWETLEEALEFAIEDCIDAGTHDLYKHGKASEFLLQAILHFIAKWLSPSVVFHSGVTDPRRAGRLPMRVQSEQLSSQEQAPEPVKPYVEMRNPRHSRQVTSIQFGDLSTGQKRDNPHQSAQEALQRNRLATDVLVSRILLNLPFSQLKVLFEMTAQLGSQHWISSEMLVQLIGMVIEAREARRRQVLREMLNKPGTDATSIRASLQCPEPRHVNKWSVLGWQEEVVHTRTHDSSFIQRTWVPIKPMQETSAAEFP